MLNMWTVKLYIFIKDRIDDKEAIPTGTASVKKGIIFLKYDFISQILCF